MQAEFQEKLDLAYERLLAYGIEPDRAAEVIKLVCDAMVGEMQYKIKEREECLSKMNTSDPSTIQ